MLLSRALLKRHSVLPGFDLALGFTLLYLSFIVLVPLSAAFLKTFTMTWPAFWSAVSAPRVVASYRLSLGASLVALVLACPARAMAAGRSGEFRRLGAAGWIGPAAAVAPTGSDAHSGATATRRPRAARPAPRTAP